MVSGAYSAGSSGYGCRHAGHSPPSSLRMRCQQNRHICESVHHTQVLRSRTLVGIRPVRASEEKSNVHKHRHNDVPGTDMYTGRSQHRRGQRAPYTVGTPANQSTHAYTRVRLMNHPLFISFVSPHLSLSLSPQTRNEKLMTCARSTVCWRPVAQHGTASQRPCLCGDGQAAP